MSATTANPPARRAKAPAPTVHEIAARHVRSATSLEINPNPAHRTRWEKTLAATWGRGDRGEWEVGMGICKGCAREIDSTPTCAEVVGVALAIPSTVCDDCMVEVREHYDPAGCAEAVEPTATPRWDANCPPRHREVALGEKRPSMIDWAAFETVRAWRTDTHPKGLAMQGEPGTGKTSAFWALARELELAGVAPITIGSVELGRVLAEAARDVREVAWLYRCRVLMIDDLGKERPTPAASSLLWEILDRRHSHGLPIIITTNFSGASIEARFCDEHLGGAIRRRLNELCAPVWFSARAQGASARQIEHRGEGTRPDGADGVVLSRIPAASIRVPSGAWLGSAASGKDFSKKY